MYSKKPGIHKDEFLSKCLHGKTKNNQSINVIWKCCPNDIYVGRTTLAIRVVSACIAFNDGAIGITNFLTKYGFSGGNFCTKETECTCQVLW